jgi:hypothetical protein
VGVVVWPGDGGALDAPHAVNAVTPRMSSHSGFYEQRTPITERPTGGRSRSRRSRARRTPRTG